MSSFHPAKGTSDEQNIQPADRICTLVIPTRPDGSVLLGRKARGFGAGKFCGFGGKVEHTDNSVEEAATRELYEETGLPKSTTLRKLGLLLYTFDSEPEFALQVHAFSCQLVGSENLVPSDEFEHPLRWFGSDGPPIPLEEMWLDASFYLPVLLQGYMFLGRFQYTHSDGLHLRTHELIILDNADLRRIDVPPVDWRVLSTLKFS